MSIMILTAETTMTIIIIHINHIVDSHEMFIFYISIYILIFIHLSIIYLFLSRLMPESASLGQGSATLFCRGQRPCR